MFYSRRRKSALARKTSAADGPPAQTAALPRSSNVVGITDTGVASTETSSHTPANNYEMLTAAPVPSVYAGLRPSIQTPPDASGNNYETLTSPSPPSVYAGLHQPQTLTNNNLTARDHVQQPSATSSNGTYLTIVG